MVVVVPDGTMQKEKRLGAEDVGERGYMAAACAGGSRMQLGGWVGVGLAAGTNGKGRWSVALATGGGPSNQSQIAGTGLSVRKRVDRARYAM